MSLLTGVLVFVWCWWRGRRRPAALGSARVPPQLHPHGRPDHRCRPGHRAGLDSAGPWAGAGRRGRFRRHQPRHRRCRTTRHGSERSGSRHWSFWSRWSSGAGCSARSARSSPRRLTMVIKHAPRAQRRAALDGRAPRPHARPVGQVKAAKRPTPRTSSAALERVAGAVGEARENLHAAALGVACPCADGILQLCDERG